MMEPIKLVEKSPYAAVLRDTIGFDGKLLK
jgi:hypothetical protein